MTHFRTSKQTAGMQHIHNSAHTRQQQNFYLNRNQTELQNLTRALLGEHITHTFTQTIQTEQKKIRNIKNNYQQNIIIYTPVAVLAVAVLVVEKLAVEKLAVAVAQV